MRRTQRKCDCYECSPARKEQRAAWEKTPKARKRQERYRLKKKLQKGA